MSIEDDILSQALTYARMGFAVLPVHRPIMEAGARVCACGKLHCASPAKHPVGRLVPRGALQASKDARQLTEWFAGTRHNIGIATGEASNLIVLDIDPRVGLSRLSNPDRLEAEPLEYHQSVRSAFVSIAAQDPGRYLVLDAMQEVDVIAAAILDRVLAGWDA